MPSGTRHRSRLDKFMKVLSYLLLFVLFIGTPVSLSAQSTYYVSLSGDNNNAGTQNSPWRTIQYSVDKTAPGDVVLVENGTYRESVTITRSGNPSAYITLKSVNQWGAKIEIPTSGKTDGVKIAANYITLDGFEIYDPDLTSQDTGNGVTVYKNHHVHILNNKIYNFGGSGIQLVHFDYALVENNITFGNAKYNPNQSSGISLFQARAVDDLPGYHIIVRNNRSYGNINLVLSGNPIGTTDGNGILIDNFHNKGASDFPVNYPHRTLVENNLAYDNGGKGVQVFESDFVDVFNNTAYHNNTDTQNTGTWRAELSLVYSNNTVWRNNIGVAQLGPGILGSNRAILIAQSENTIWENNLTYNGSPGDISINFSNTSVTQEDMSNNLLGVDPQFISPGSEDFSLNESSPAVDSGSDQIATFLDINYHSRTPGQVDLGAFERGSSVATDVENTPSPSAFTLTGNYPNPFINRTEILYHLKESTHVYLELYNAAGQRMAVLVDQELPPGEYSTPVDGSTLPSGVYFYRLRAGNTSQVKTIVRTR